MEVHKEMSRRFSVESLGYSMDFTGSLGKTKDLKLRRSSEGTKGHIVDEAHFELLSKRLLRSMSTRTTSTIEEEDRPMVTDELLQRSSFKNHSKTFHKQFPEISEIEDLISAFTCALQKEVLYHGKMYVSQNHVCFYSSVLLKETKVKIHVSTIQIIKKKTWVVPNAISIITNTGEKYLFGTLHNRDVCFNALKSMCPQLQDACIKNSPGSSAENGNEPEGDTISSHSSLEDSNDHQRVSVLRQDTTSASSVPVSKISHARNNSASWNSTNRDDHSSEENTAVSWVVTVTEKIRYLLSMGGTMSVNKLVIVYLILALLLLLSSGYIGLRIAALEKQLNTLGATNEFSLQRPNKET